LLGRNVRVYDVAYLNELQKTGRLVLRPEYQRNAIWSNSARSYLIDTALRGRPVPLLFLQPIASTQSGLPGFAVVDGQQRLLAIFDFLDGRYRLSGPDITAWRGMFFADLPAAQKRALTTYPLVAEELIGYSDKDIKDIFVRINRYGVRLTAQEIRNARESGRFKRVVEDVATWDFWTRERVFSAQKTARMRNAEFAAELLILLLTGSPQDKKSSIDLHYRAFARQFPEAKQIASRLSSYLRWVSGALRNEPRSRFRKPVDLYSLIGALHELSERRGGFELSIVEGGRRLGDFDRATRGTSAGDLETSKYLVAASRQTDNYIPRLTRQQILVGLLSAEAAT
jgi:hypothetical protein